jgi:hypothetical protein
LHLLRGERLYWPLHLLLAWEFHPGTAEVLYLQLGERVATITGTGLAQVAERLSEGRGGILTESGARYAALVAPEIAYVASIEIGTLAAMKAAEGLGGLPR